MGERVKVKETISRGELFFLGYPGTVNTFSGYGLTVEERIRGKLVGVLMVDRPRTADPDWLKQVGDTFGEYNLVAMTATGERGIVCRMRIEAESLAHLWQLPFEKATAIRHALEPLLEDPPNPAFALRWDEDKKLWVSRFVSQNYLNKDIR